MCLCLNGRPLYALPSVEWSILRMACNSPILMLKVSFYFITRNTSTSEPDVVSRLSSRGAQPRLYALKATSVLLFPYHYWVFISLGTEMDDIMVKWLLQGWGKAFPSHRQDTLLCASPQQ